jgi:hypothetical protein
MEKPTSYTLPAHLVRLAISFLTDHAYMLSSIPASADVVRSLATRIQEQVDLQTPQTVEEQVAVLTQVMGCGPTDELKGNRD